MFIFMLCFLIGCKLSKRFTHNSLILGGLSVPILGKILSVTLMTGPAAQRAIEKQHCYLGRLNILSSFCSNCRIYVSLLKKKYYYN